MQRSLLLFENSIKSEQSREKYRYHLDKFLEFTKIKDYDALANLDADTIQMLLENYVIHLKDRKLKAKSIRNYLNGVELFFDVNKKIYYKRVLRKMMPEDTKEGNDQPYTTEDIQKMLKVTKSKREIALIHFFASTGARPRVLLDPVLKLRHLYPMTDGCKGILLYEGSKSEYWAFLTPEAVKTLDEYFDERRLAGEIINSDSPMFSTFVKVKKQKVRPISHNHINSIMFRILQKAGLERIKVGNRFDKALYYGMRKRFNGILKMNNSINSNIAEKLMAHKKGLDGVYLRPTREQCFTEFRKAIAELTIDESEREKIKRIAAEKKVESLETEKDVKIRELENKLSSVHDIIEEIKSRMKD
jgi:integrase/recombinase XerD